MGKGVRKSGTRAPILRKGLLAVNRQDGKSLLIENVPPDPLMAHSVPPGWNYRMYFTYSMGT